MANDPQNRTILDQLTSAATAPQPAPSILGGADTSAPTDLTSAAPTPPTLLSPPAQTAGDSGTQDLESKIASPGNIAAGVAADKATDQQTQLQNPSMLQKIGRIAATVAGGPQLATPGATPEQKAAGIMGILGKVGNVGVMATGSPQQREQAIQQQGQQNQLLQMQNEAAYRQALTQNNANKTAEQIYKDRQIEQLKQQNTDLAYRKQNMVPDESRPGMHRAATPDETLANPDMNRNSEMWQAANALKNSQAALAAAKTDVSKNQNTQFMKALEEKYYRDQTNYQLASSRMQFQAQSQARQDYRDKMNLGQDQFGNQLTPTNAAPGMLTDATGQPVPFRAMSQYAATSQMKNVSAQAKLAAGQIPSIIKEVNDLRDSLGPVAGRWNEFMQGKVGTDNPAFAGLRADLMMQGTAVALAHARGRLPENLRQEFDNMINAPQQAPDNIIAVLTHIQPWLDRAGTMSEQPLNPPNIKPRAGAPQAPPPQNIPGQTAPGGMKLTYQGQTPVDSAQGPGGHIILKMKQGGPWIDMATGKPI